MTIKERIKEYCEKKNIALSRFEHCAGISNGYFNNVKKTPIRSNNREDSWNLSRPQHGMAPHGRGADAQRRERGKATTPQPSPHPLLARRGRNSWGSRTIRRYHHRPTHRPRHP